jgi:hypothetical protein
MTIVLEPEASPRERDGAGREEPFAPPAGSEPPPSRRLLVYVAPPLVAISAAIAAVLLSRRAGRSDRAAAKPGVDWKLEFLSGNSLTFRPTLAPRFAGLFVPRGRRR